MNQSTNTDSKNSKEPQQKYRLGTVSIKILGGLNRFYRRLTSPSASIMAQNIQLFGPRGGYLVNSVPHEQNQMDSEDMNFVKSDPSSSKLQNSDILKDLDQKLSHLDSDKRLELKQLILEYEHLFPDIPSRTDKIYHDVYIIDGSKPVKQHPYRMNPVKQQYLREEVQYLLNNDFIEPSQSEWSSPCILVPKPDGTFRMCTDYRNVNSVTKTDTFPIPRIDDCIDNIGHAKYVTKFDLLKGFWQMPLTNRAKEISAFVTPDGLYQYEVMPFGMKNSPATF